MIQFIHLLTYRRPSIYISIAITGYWGIGVWLVTGRVAARVAELLGRSWPDILDFLEFTARAGLIGNAKEHLVLILESLQIFLSFFFGLLILFHRYSPTSHRSSQSILDVIMVGKFSKTVLSTVRHIISLRHSCLLANHTVALGTVMLRHLVVGSFVGAQETMPKSFLLILWDPEGYVAVIYISRSIRGDIPDLGWCSFPIVFNLNCGQVVKER